MDLNRARHWKWLLPLLAGTAGVTVLYAFSPQENGFYPKCLFFTLTGLTCPGCGALRSLHHLLHGEMAAAFHFNPLAVILFPFVVGGFLFYAFRVAAGKESGTEPFWRPAWLWVPFAVGIVFAIARNLPFGPLASFRL